MAIQPVDETEDEERNTTFVSITGVSNKEFYVLANLSPTIDDPDSIESAIVELSQEPDFDGEILYDAPIWMTSMDQAEGGNLFAVSMDGELHYRRNGNWGVQDLKCPDGLLSVWAAGDNEIFAVGNGGAMLRASGQSVAVSRDAKERTMRGVHGTSVQNVWAVGDKGVIFKYDGRNWTEVNSPTNYNLFVVLCVSEDEIYVAGSHGMLFRYTEGDWEHIPADDLSITGLSLYKKTLYLACGQSGVWFVGSDGIEESTSHILRRLRTIKSRLFAVGGNQIYRYNGKDWRGGDLDL